MTREQLAERIGNIDDRLVQQAERIPSYQKRRRGKRFRQLAACAAALVLMAGCFAAGVLVEAHRTAAREPVGIGVIDLTDEIGIHMLLPESWREEWDSGFGVEAKQDGSYSIYSKEIRRACMASDDNDFVWGGVLFSVVRLPGQFTEEQIRENGERGCVYIAATRDSTYLLYYEQDVQYTPDTEEKYFQMQAEVRDIQFIVSETARNAISISQSMEEKFEGTMAGIVKGISIDSITVDLVEYVEEDDTERLRELGVTEEDMWDGFYIYNPGEEQTTYTYSDGAVFTFIDWNGDFTGLPYPSYYTTESLEEFHEYVKAYVDGWLLLFFRMEDGVIRYVLERPIM
ncbi:MAG: hypothetical protein K2L18_04215 [Acetatifactor sp.]|nr:hypothetical protein [Acetatifactor sp.]